MSQVGTPRRVLDIGCGCGFHDVLMAERPGVELKPIPDAPKPGPTATSRLKQMRTLAAEYSVTAQYGDSKEQLRLLPAPVYRYASEKQGVTDGALFAFARGTDPDDPLDAVLPV